MTASIEFALRMIELIALIFCGCAGVAIIYAWIDDQFDKFFNVEDSLK